MTDNDTQQRRRAALRALIDLSVPPAEAAADLAPFGWDSDRELVTLTRADVLRALDRYQRQELAAGDLRRWAEALEGRDDVALEPGFAEPLTEFLFQAATPELSGPLTAEMIGRWRAIFDVSGPGTGPMPLERILRVMLRGEVDQARLVRLRELLALTPIGRLTDREDAEFGYRYLEPEAGPHLEMDLWRDEDTRWEVVLLAPGTRLAEVDPDLVARLRAGVVAAAAEVGLEVTGEWRPT